MKRILSIILCSILTLLVWGCYGKHEPSHDVLARVGEHTLTTREVLAEVPAGLNDSARAVFIEHYINEWISSQLIYDMARKNLSNIDHLNNLVEAYRRDLYAYEYRKRLSDERLAADLPEDTIMAFYKAHRNEFTLQRNIAKGVFLKVPAQAPQLSALRKWVASAGVQDVENIEKYAVKNAIGYDYFLDRWVNTDDLKDNIPYEFDSKASVLKPQKMFEHKSNDMIYMLYIDSCLYVGDVMPYEVARQRIVEILLNERRMSFNKELEQALYQEAVADGLVERYDVEMNTEK
ncbi:MAG: hypothetical protein IKY75_07745 [Bacteroidaceae bacterium]|nr:hypothetical protein [Bacteroidaceae bacterium]